MSCEHVGMYAHTPLSHHSLPFYFSSLSSLYSLPFLPSFATLLSSLPSPATLLPSISCLCSPPFRSVSPSSLSSPSYLPCSLLSLHYLRCMYAASTWMLICACLSCDVGQGQSDLPVVPGGNSRELLANMTAHTYSHVHSFTSLLFLYR